MELEKLFGRFQQDDEILAMLGESDLADGTVAGLLLGVRSREGEFTGGGPERFTQAACADLHGFAHRCSGHRVEIDNRPPGDKQQGADAGPC